MGEQGIQRKREQIEINDEEKNSRTQEQPDSCFPTAIPN